MIAINFTCMIWGRTCKCLPCSGLRENIPDGPDIAGQGGMGKILGIDLGTTNSCMAVMESGEATVIPNSEGARTTPSVVAFSKNGERLVGQAAKRQAVTNPRNTIFSAKRLIGRKFSEVSEEAESLPYKVIEGKNGDAYIECQVGDKTEKFAPEQIAAMVLGKLKSDAESKLGEKIGMKILMGPYSVYCNMEGNRGLTAVTIIETSHIAMHSWDEGEPGLLQLDVYTCGPLDPQAVADAIAEFEPTKIERKYLDRETNLFQLKLPKPKKIKTDIKADIKDHLKKCWRTLSDSNPFNK